MPSSSSKGKGTSKGKEPWQNFGFPPHMMPPFDPYSAQIALHAATMALASQHWHSYNQAQYSEEDWGQRAASSSSGVVNEELKKFLEILKGNDSEKKKKTIEELIQRPDFVSWAKDKDGTRVVQEVINQAEGDLAVEVAKKFKGEIRQGMQDLQGNYVIRCLAERPMREFLMHQKSPDGKKILDLQIKREKHLWLGPEQSEAIFNVITDDLQPLGTNDLVDLASNQYACRTFCRLLEATDKNPPEGYKKIVNRLLERVGDLIINPFAHWIMERVVMHGMPEQRKQVVNSIVRDPQLANQAKNNKYFAYVTEKALLHSSPEEQKELVNAFLKAMTPRDLASLVESNQKGAGKILLQKMLKEPKDGDKKTDDRYVPAELRDQVRNFLDNDDAKREFSKSKAGKEFAHKYKLPTIDDDTIKEPASELTTSTVAPSTGDNLSTLTSVSTGPPEEAIDPDLEKYLKKANKKGLCIPVGEILDLAKQIGKMVEERQTFAKPPGL